MLKILFNPFKNFFSEGFLFHQLIQAAIFIIFGMEVKHHFNMSFSNIIHMEHHPQTQVERKCHQFRSQKTTIQWFRKPEEATHFMLRRFEIQPGGFIGVHSHPEEDRSCDKRAHYLNQWQRE